VALDAPVEKIHCAAYNVGSESNNLTVADIAGSVVDVTSGAKLVIAGETGSDPRSYRVDFSKFRDAVGFEASWSVADGAAELHQAYVSEGLTDHDFANRFSRLSHLDALCTSGSLDESMRWVRAAV
jgi:nucleoside-diphosphate-sugar epimerase